MDFKSHLERAWSLTLKYIAPMILMTLVMAVAGFFTLGILAPVMMAGYMQSVLMMLRSGREPRIQDLFSEMRLFLPLLGFGLAVFILIMIGISLLVLPGIVIICGVSYTCLYMLPLMTDRNFSITDAVKESFNMVKGPDFMDHIITAILFLGISTIGSSVFIGFLFTQPLATIFLLSVYEEKTGSIPCHPPASEPAEEIHESRSSESDDGITLKYKP
ncbi:MAG: hypothetical protein V2I97_25100 [Desulfococcaceae bacterium]|jgi:hypothetical protein|nr:hypothetical protein [Desulfococcaceae bacterium]